MKFHTLMIDERNAILMSESGIRIVIRRTHPGRKLPVNLNRWHIRADDDLGRQLADMYSEKAFIIQVAIQAARRIGQFYA